MKVTLNDGARKWSSPSVFNDPFDNMIDIQWAWDPLDFEKKMNGNLCRLAQETNPDLSTWPADM
ncbi:MAG: hypothetical protein LBB60_04290, partial [Desulfovibrio sp.]|nr:hypothetical protein [Desulfovibrio sp.]